MGNSCAAKAVDTPRTARLDKDFDSLQSVELSTQLSLPSSPTPRHAQTPPEYPRSEHSSLMSVGVPSRDGAPSTQRSNDGDRLNSLASPDGPSKLTPPSEELWHLTPPYLGEIPPDLSQDLVAFSLHAPTMPATIKSMHLQPVYRPRRLGMDALEEESEESDAQIRPTIMGRNPLLPFPQNARNTARAVGATDERPLPLTPPPEDLDTPMLIPSMHSTHADDAAARQKSVGTWLASCSPPLDGEDTLLSAATSVATDDELSPDLLEAYACVP